MRRHGLASLAVLAMIGVARGEEPKKASPKPPKDRPHDRLKMPPLRAFDPPKAKRVELPNGVPLYVLEDRELPLVEVRVTLRAGGLWDPEDKVGLASIAGSVWRTGGTRKHPKEELDALLEKKGAVLEVSVGEDQGTIVLSVLKEDVDLGLGLLRELLEEPLYPKDKLDQAKREALAAIERRNDEAPPIASRVFDMQVFGKKSPLARQTETETVAAIGEADLLAWHERYVRPANAIVGAYGDLDAATLEKKLAAALGSWKAKGDEKKPELPLVDVARKPSWTVVQKDVNQSAIVIGHVGGVRTPETIDEYARVVCMNEILGGGGFTSRLVINVRSDMGLAYSVYSRHGLDYDKPGTYQLVCQTKSESTVKAIKAMLGEVDRIRSELCTEEELAVAKESILNQVPFWVDTTGEVMDRTLTYAYRGFPQDTLRRFTEALAKVTREDVLATAKAVWKPEAMVGVICGNEAAFDAKIDGLAGGKVERFEDPDAWAKGEAAKPAAPAGASKEAQELVQKIVEAAGGKKALDALVAIHMKETITVGDQTFPREQTIQYPDKVRQIRVEQGMKVTLVYDGKKGWAVAPGQGMMELPAPWIAQVRGLLDNQTIALLKAAAEGTLEASVLEKTPEAVKLSAKRPGAKKPAVLLVDPASGKLLGREDDGPDGKIRIGFDEWKEFAGVRVPVKVTVKSGEKVLQTLSVDVLEPNPKIGPETFAKPEAPEVKPEDEDE